MSDGPDALDPTFSDWLCQPLELANDPKVVEQGRAYAADGHVEHMQLGRAMVSAVVKGTTWRRHIVTATVLDDTMRVACDCDDGSALCKHVVAVMVITCERAGLSGRSTPASPDTPAVVHTPSPAVEAPPQLSLDALISMPVTALRAWARARNLVDWTYGSVVDLLKVAPAPANVSVGGINPYLHVEHVLDPSRDAVDPALRRHVGSFLLAQERLRRDYIAELRARVWPKPVAPSLVLYATRLTEQLALLLEEGAHPTPPAQRLETRLRLKTVPEVRLEVYLRGGWDQLVAFTFEDDDVSSRSGVSRHNRADAAIAVLDAITVADPVAPIDTLISAVGIPAWKRSLDVVAGRIANESALEVRGKEAELGWRVTEGSYRTLRLVPVACAERARGGYATRQIKRDELDALADHTEHDGDLRALDLCSGDGAKEPALAAVLDTLERLVGHPRVFYRDDGKDQHVRVETGKVQPCFREEDGEFLPGLRFGPEWLSFRDLEELRYTTRFRGARYAPDRNAFQVLSWSGPTDRLLKSARLLPATLPKEAADAVVSLSDALAQKGGAVELPRALRGKQATSSRECTVRLTMDAGGGLVVTFVIYPCDGAASQTPGQGPEVVHGKRGDQRLFAERDLQAEIRAAATAAESLGFEADADCIWVIDSRDEALEFLKMLEHESRSVEWTSPERYHFAGSLGVADLQLRVTPAKRNWFEPKGAARVKDGTTLPLADLLRAIREQRKWVRVKGDRWAHIGDKLDKALAPLAEREQLTAELAPLIAALADDGADVDGAEAWRVLTTKMRSAATVEAEVPPGFVGELRPYQLDGFRWLARLAEWSRGACLADDMGLGKTIQALVLMLRRAAIGPQLVVGPTSLGFNWEREARRFAPELDVTLLRGRADFERLGARTPGPAEVWITSYDLVHRNQERLSAIPWATVAIDEAQNIKNPGTQRARGIFALDAAFTLALTGTPVENRSSEVWSLFRAIAPGLLGNKAFFRERFAVPIERHKSPRARAALAQLIRPFVLRRLKGDVAKELPPLTEVQLDVILSPSERRLYEELRQSTVASLRGLDGTTKAQNRFKALQSLTRLRQLACAPKLCDPKSTVPSAKLRRARELVSRLVAEGHRALIFSQFTTLLGMMRDQLVADGVSLRYLDGSTPAKRRAEEVDAFQAGEGDVFLLSLKAGGVGLNLTGADYVIHLDPWWNPAAEDQATDRAHRIGQTRAVTVYRLITRGTVEEGIVKLHDDKRALADALLEGTGSSAALDFDTIVGLLHSGAAVLEDMVPDVEEPFEEGRFEERIFHEGMGLTTPREPVS